MKSPSRICRWERRSALPNLIHTAKLSILYEVLIDDLFAAHRMALFEGTLRKGGDPVTGGVSKWPLPVVHFPEIDYLFRWVDLL
jgi:hypothetical protein